MILCLEYLEVGIQWWINVRPKWGSDLMNSEYFSIFEDRNSDISQLWWNNTVDRLWNWMAIRSPKPPNTKQQILDAGAERLEKIAAIVSEIRSTSESEPSITDASWELVAPLFREAFEIKCGHKRTASPVFASKMCHFIFPNVFPVMDNFATGIFDYEFYWRGIKDEWERFPDKQVAREIVRKALPVEGVHSLYPYETKIMELSTIGYTHFEEVSASAPPDDPALTSGCTGGVAGA